MEFMNRILRVRQSLNLTQDRFAEFVSVSRRTVAAWESGARLPSLERLCEIADTCHVSTDYLLGRTSIPNIYTNNDTDLDTVMRTNHADLYPQQMPATVQELSALIQQIIDNTLKDKNA